MLTNEETIQIVDKFIDASKQIFYTKTDMDDKFDDLRKNFSTVQTSVESFAVETKTNREEIKVTNHRIDQHEDWINKAAPKVGLEFKP